MSVLTVGAGGEFKTISDAVAASHDGDVIKVQAGTYTNDFSIVNTKITIEGVGGMVKLVATVPPTNGKAFFVTNTDVTIANFDISGGTDKTSTGNIAAIRYQAGNLTVENDYLHDNQEGLLAGDDLNGSITIDHTEIADNGSDGLTHNVYIGDVGSTVLSNSSIHDVLDGGTEFRSRGPKTTIVNDRIYDGNGNANYVIDLPSGGDVLIANNVLQKSGDPSNPAVIHWGGGVVTPFHTGSSLTVTNNTIIDRDSQADSYLILNQSNLDNATSQVTVPVISGDTFYGSTASRISNLAAALSGNALDPLAAAPAIDTSHPWTAPTTVWDPTADPEIVLLTTSDHTVSGGAALLTVTDTAGGNTITGGSGGLVVNSTGQTVTITTAAGAADTVTAASRSLIRSAGNDVIDISGIYNAVSVSGHATITSGTGGGNTFTITQDSVVLSHSTDTVHLIGAAATVTGAGAGLYVTESQGIVTFAETGGSVVSRATVSGGAATISGSAANGTLITTGTSGGVSVVLGSGNQTVASKGADTISAGSGADIVRASGASLDFIGGAGAAYIAGGTGAMTVSGGAGNMTLVGGSGGSLFTGGAGRALITEGGGTNSVRFGTGNTTVTGGSGADIYHVTAGQGGSHDLIRNFQIGTDKLDLGPASILSQSVAGGALVLTLSEGTTIALAGLTKFSSAILA